MQIQTKLLLTQLMLLNLTNLIAVGNSEVKQVMTIILNSGCLIINLVIFCLNYAKFKEDIINVVLQLQIILELEFIFTNAIQAHFTLIYICALIDQLRKTHKCYQILTHIICLYVAIRIIAQYYVGTSTFELILFVLWQPLNHLIYYKDKCHSKPVPQLTPKQVEGAHQSYAEQIKVNLIEDKIPLHQQNINLPLDLELLNCLPYGLALIESTFQLIKCNEKLLHYLNVVETEEVVHQLDLLLSNAEINLFKSNTQNKKHRPHIVPLRNLKQNSASQNHKTHSATQNWLSDKLKINNSFQSSINEQVQHQYVQFVMNEFLTKSHRQMNQIPDNQSIASDQTTRVFKFHVVQEIRGKKKHLQIKVYEVNLKRKTQDPVYLFIIENITDKEELKQLTYRYKFQQALLNSFSHELRTPLNSSLPLLQMLSKKIENDLNNNYLNPAIISCKRLLYQINDILDYAQIECKDFKLNQTKFYVSDIFDELKELFQKECDQKQIELITNPYTQLYLQNDKQRITQILVNLMNNSIKFTKQGGRIVLALNKRDQKLFFSVWDNGEGMDPEIPSQYISNLQNKLGLGLRVSRGIVKHLIQGGELVIESQKNRFTKISFAIDEQKINLIKDYDSLHCDDIGSDSKDSVQRVYVSQKNFLNNCGCIQILIVDDVPFNHIALMALLQSFGWKIDSAYDGDSAIKKVKQKLQNNCCKTYRLIFMDIEMPGKNGFITSNEISQLLQKENQNCTIVMCSAYNGQENAELAHKNGMNEIITKPITLDSLQSLLSKYLL